MSGEPLLEVKDLHVVFGKPRSRFRGGTQVHAVNGVSLDIADGEVLGLVGESGSGKSTVGRAIMRLVQADHGSVVLDGVDWTKLERRELRRVRRQMQLVFQDPYSSLDPSMVVGESVGEPLRVHEGLRGRAKAERTVEVLERVGLDRQVMDRYPYEFSGGQRQRIAIARAIVVRPRVLICDEIVSALDVSTQNQIINLLEELRDEYRLSYLFISHDLAVVRHTASRLAVMYMGRIVEIGPSERVIREPAHPYTEALLAAVPTIRRTAPRDSLAAPGREAPAPEEPGGDGRSSVGCPFRDRCAYAMDICADVMPEPTPVAGGGTVRCHLQTTGPELQGASLPQAREQLAPRTT